MQQKCTMVEAEAENKAQGPNEEKGARRKRIAAAIEHAQAVVANYVPVGRSLSEELIQERRREAANDAELVRKDSG